MIYRPRLTVEYPASNTVSVCPELTRFTPGVNGGILSLSEDSSLCRGHRRERVRRPAGPRSRLSERPGRVAIATAPSQLGPARRRELCCRAGSVEYTQSSHDDSPTIPDEGRTTTVSGSRGRDSLVLSSGKLSYTRLRLLSDGGNALSLASIRRTLRPGRAGRPRRRRGRSRGRVRGRRTLRYRRGPRSPLPAARPSLPAGAS